MELYFFDTKIFQKKLGKSEFREAEQNLMRKGWRKGCERDGARDLAVGSTYNNPYINIIIYNI